MGQFEERNTALEKEKYEIIPFSENLKLPTDDDIKEDVEINAIKRIAS